MALTLGVELEATFPYSKAAERLERERTGWHGGFNQAPDFPDGWGAQSDSSILLTNGDDYLAAELISPALYFPYGMDSVITALETLQMMDARTNPSCGLHVHVGVPMPTVTFIERLQALTRRYEFALYGASGAFIASRMASDHGRHYCATSLSPLTGDSHDDRYRGLNLTRLETQPLRRKTVEFRMFQCSTNVSRVLGPIAMAVALVYAAQGDTPLPGKARITSPVAAMREFIDGPWHYIARDIARYDLEQTLIRQARKAERMLGVV